MAQRAKFYIFCGNNVDGTSMGGGFRRKLRTRSRLHVCLVSANRLCSSSGLGYVVEADLDFAASTAGPSKSGAPRAGKSPLSSRYVRGGKRVCASLGTAASSIEQRWRRSSFFFSFLSLVVEGNSEHAVQGAMSAGGGAVLATW